DRDRGQGLWPPEGPHRDLSRRRIRRELPAQDQDRGRGRGRTRRQRHRDHHRRSPHRTDRRRQDLRVLAREGRPDPHRRDRRRRPLSPDIQEFSHMDFKTVLRAGLPALATAATFAAGPALAQAAAAPALNSGDTAWMIVSTVLVLLMIVPGLALFYGGLVRSKNMLSVLTQVLCVACMTM